MSQRLLIFYLIIIFFSIISVSQGKPEKSITALLNENSTIKGYVYDTETGETIIGATVYLESTAYGSYTNKSGYFSVTGIPAGEYKLKVSSIGYESLTEKIKFKKNESIRRDFKLNPSSIKTGEVAVEAEKEVEKRQITISKIDIPVSQLKEIRVGGEADIFRSLQYLPGILTSSQLSSGLFVRGGSPDQNLILLDGSTVYNPTHLFGFISTFNPEAIKDVELIKGGFPAEYGGRLSAVLNITQKDGNREKIEGTASLGAISSRLALDGPIGNGSWFIGGRRTYLELIMGLLKQDPQNPFPSFNFYDLNGKITQNITEDDKVFLSGFMSADNLSYSSNGFNLNMDIGNQTGALRWTHIFGDRLFSIINLSGSHYDNNFAGDQSGYAFAINNSITDYSLKGNLEWFTSEKVTHQFGIEITKYKFNYYQNFTGEKDSTSQSGSSKAGELNLNVYDWNYALFGQANYNFADLWSLQAGLRANFWELSNTFTLEPRLALRYQFLYNVALKAAWGIYHQNLRLATQNDFSFFDTWLPSDTSLPVSKATHYIISLETTPWEGFDLNFDMYYKKMENVGELNRYVLQARNTSDVFVIGNTDSYGAEVFLQKKFGQLSGWVGYALGFITSRFDSINNGQSFRPKYDRRHDFKAVAQYKINDKWEVGATFIFQSGQSYTGATSRLQMELPNQDPGRGLLYPSNRYEYRLPPSHQLNLNASFSFHIWDKASKLIFDIYNVYNRRDIWFRYYNTRTFNTKVEEVRLLPIIPSVSLEVKF
jgi:hypothetical protein